MIYHCRIRKKNLKQTPSTLSGSSWGPYNGLWLSLFEWGVCHPLFAAKSHKVIWSRNHVEDGHCLSDLVNFNVHQRCCRNSATFLDTPISAGNRRKHHLPSTCTFLRSMFEYFTKVYKVLKNLRTTVKCHVKSWFTYTDIIHAVWKTIFHIETVPFQLTFGHSRGSIQSQMHHLWNFWTYV